MASNFRGTQRQLYNPSTVKYLSDQDIKSEYQALRRIANRRAERLRSSGYTGYAVSEKRFPKASSLTPEQMQAELLNVSSYLRDPRSTRPGFRAFQEEQQEALSKYKDVISKNPKAFGDFMESARRRAGGRLADSASVRMAYEEAVARGMRPATLQKHFDSYLTDRDKLQDLGAALYQAPVEGRLTIAALKALL